MPIEYRVYRSDPSTTAVYGGGQDPELLDYQAASEDLKEQYSIDSNSLSNSFGDFRDLFKEEIKKQTNVQGGGYGVPGGQVARRSAAPAFPGWLIPVALIAWWFYR